VAPAALGIRIGGGPFDRWPLGRGFERFYGFLGGDTSQWHPELVYDNHQVEPPRTPEQGYHLTEDLADKAIEFIADAKQVAPHKPFYLHFCTGAGHAPHHVAKENSGYCRPRPSCHVTTRTSRSGNP
jgi:arylsulfatase